MIHIIFFLTLLFTSSTLIGQNPIMRFPDIHDNTVVFVSGEDIWKVSAEGGIAQKITFHDGSERFPRFSPDGKLIAFTGEYDGNSDVYVMDPNGGNITRVTYHPDNDEVIGWHPSKNKIMFTSGRVSTSRYTKLFLISPDGSGLEEVILYDVARASFSPDGSKIAFNKTNREDRTWKRYKGGRAQEVYLYDLNTDEEAKITNFEGTDRMPMWIGNKIYFSSDRDRVLNIFAYNTLDQNIEKITNHTDYDIRRPEFDQNHIIYEKGGDIWITDISSNESRKIPIEVAADFEETRPYLKDVSKEITEYSLSPDGNKALFVARGEIFTVPKEEGRTINLTNESGAYDRGAVWSPDGNNIAYLSDISGEYEIYIIDKEGEKEAIKLTNHNDGYRHTLRWSPDSKMIAFTDQTLTLYILNVATKKITKVDKAKHENVDVAIHNKPISDFSWSPDSRYIAYSRMNEAYMYQVYIYALATGKINCVSNGLFHDFEPVFTKDGNHLLFISNRRFSPTYCDLEWEMVYKDIAGIYAITLQKNGPSILPYDDGKQSNSNGNVIIDFDNINDRVETLPLPRGNYRSLTVNENQLFYLNSEDGDYNKFDFRGTGPQNLYCYSFATQKSNEITKKISGYRLSEDGSHIIYNQGQDYQIIPVNNPSAITGIDVSNMEMWFVPIKEWKQIFTEAWRYERDYYYEPNMHGIDWPAMKEKYGKLIPNATCRQDVQFIIGELIGELNTSHTYVYGGDTKREGERVNIGMLGADYKVDQSANKYQFKKIFRERDWSREVYPPLAKPGVYINEGDYLLQVNGEDVTAHKNIYSYFIGLAGEQVTLTINNNPSLSGAREVIVEPLYSDRTLRYMDWLETNRKIVDEASGGKIGYIYFPDTYNGSATDFPKYFYSQTKKEGLIIDGRFNGGGLDPEIFFQRLLKKPHGFWTRRYSADQPIPHLAVDAHMACLTNRYAGSGGDELPYEFQWNNMGPVIGTRTWGGLVGVSQFIRMIDGGGMTAPDYRIYNEEGEWVVENVGVQPDIVIDIDSKKMSEGYDTQLMKAVDYLMKKIEAEPRDWPEHDPYPVDSPEK